MKKYNDLAKRMVGILNKLEDKKDLHLTSIAKAIEVEVNDSIKIIFKGQPEKKIKSKIRGLTISQEVSVKLPGCDDNSKITEHFIYYSTNANTEERRFAIGHELAHILLHYPKHRKRKYINKDKPFYVLNFTKDDEAEADMFTSLLTEQRRAPRRQKKFVLPCIRDLTKFKNKELIQSKLATMVPKKVACTHFCSPDDHCREF